MSIKCIVAGCENRTDQGKFVGELCVPCHRMLTTGELGYGNTFVHERINNAEGKLVRAEILDRFTDPRIAKREDGRYNAVNLCLNMASVDFDVMVRNQNKYRKA